MDPVIVEYNEKGERNDFHDHWFVKLIDENTAVFDSRNKTRETWTYTAQPQPDQITITIDGRSFQFHHLHPLMRWAEWEDNGYHDSYFHEIYWDADLQEAFQKEIGATAYGGGIQHWESVPWTAEELEKARLWHADKILAQLVKAEQDDVLTPNSIEKGDRVRLLERQRCKATAKTQEPCPKCNGSGEWVNPRNSEDRRICFACNGQKTVERRGDKLKNEDGKQVWEVFEKDTAGVVVWVGTFRTIYQKGYNRLGRSTLSCRVKADDGRTFAAPLSKLRLDKEPLTADELRQRADELSYEMNPKPHFSGHGGWLTNNQARACLEVVNKE